MEILSSASSEDSHESFLVKTKGKKKKKDNQPEKEVQGLKVRIESRGAQGSSRIDDSMEFTYGDDKAK